MKQSLLLVAALALTLTSTSAFAKIKIGIVNVQKVLVSIDEGQSVKTKLEKTFNEKKEELKKEEDKIKKAQEDFSKQSLVMNEKAKAKKEKDLQDMIMKIQQKMNTYQKDINELENKYKGPILEKIEAVVDEVSKSAGADLTFEAAVAPLYADSKEDLTDKIISAYNKKYPVKK